MSAVAPIVTAPRPDRRTVICHLTPFVRGLEMVPVNDSKRMLAMWPTRPVQAVSALLDRIGLKPNAVRIERIANGEIEIRATRADFQRWVPVAFVWEGLTLGEVRDALDQLQATAA